MACTTPIPSGTVTVTLPGKPDTAKLNYREEVHHPALPFPKVTTGTLAIAPNGRLIRHQLTPVVEIVEIGEDVLFVRKGEEGEPNMLPIPDRMQGLFGFLRKVASAQDRSIDVHEDQLREADPAGWRALLGTYAEETRIWVLGCNNHALGFLVQGGDGIQRRTLFETAQDRAE